MRALKRAGRRAADPAQDSPSVPSRSCRRGALALIACVAAVFGSTSGTQDAVANGDTRTISIFHEHTKESAAITFKRDGRYDRAALEQLNWLLRDWRLDEPTKMDPACSTWCGSPPRPSARRTRSTSSRPIAPPRPTRRSAAAPARWPSTASTCSARRWISTSPTSRSTRSGRSACGCSAAASAGTPQANSPFVHLDVGSVRSWPRMSHDQLARLFPDGRTVHLPADGRPLAGYESARAEILARGGSVMGVSQAIAAADEEDSPNVVGQFFAMLFGGSKPAAAPPPAPVVLSGRAGRVRPGAGERPAGGCARRPRLRGARHDRRPPAPGRAPPGRPAGARASRGRPRRRVRAGGCRGRTGVGRAGQTGSVVHSAAAPGARRNSPPWPTLWSPARRRSPCRFPLPARLDPDRRGDGRSGGPGRHSPEASADHALAGPHRAEGAAERPVQRRRRTGGRGRGHPPHPAAEARCPRPSARSEPGRGPQPRKTRPVPATSADRRSGAAERRLRTGSPRTGSRRSTLSGPPRPAPSPTSMHLECFDAEPDARRNSESGTHGTRQWPEACRPSSHPPPQDEVAGGTGRSRT